MKQIGTTGTKLLSASRARRKVPMRKVMRLIPEIVYPAPRDKLSLFVTIPDGGDPGVKILLPGLGRSGCKDSVGLEDSAPPYQWRQTDPLPTVSGLCPKRQYATNPAAQVRLRGHVSAAKVDKCERI